MGCESGSGGPKPRKTPNAILAKVAAAALALLSAVGCGKEAPSGWDVHDEAQACAGKTPGATCEDQAKLVDAVFANPACKLPSKETRVKTGEEAVDIVRDAIAKACKVGNGRSSVE
jgi:hypothetical protein